MLAIYLCIMRLEYIASIYYNETVSKRNNPRPTGQPTGRKEIEMKVRQFLNKFLYASSSIHRIFVVRGVEEKTQLIGIAVNPMATDTPYEKQLNATLVSFRITGEDLTIYVK